MDRRHVLAGLAAAAASPAPYRVLQPVRPDEDLPAAHPASGKRTVGGRAAAYVCVGTTCEAPLTDAAELGRRLGGTPAGAEGRGRAWRSRPDVA